MKAPDQVPQAVTEALARYAKRHQCQVPTVQWDVIMGCYYFVRLDVYHGVELDGHIHT